MRDENQLCVAVAGRLPPSLQPAGGEPSKAASSHAVVTPPVIGKLEVVEAGASVELAGDGSNKGGVAVDLPESWQQVCVREDTFGHDPVAEHIGSR